MLPPLDGILIVDGIFDGLLMVIDGDPLCADGILDGFFFSSPDSSSEDMLPPLDGILIVDGIFDGLLMAIDGDPLLVDGILDGFFFSSPDSSSEDMLPPLEGVLDLVDGIFDGLLMVIDGDPLCADGILDGFFFSSPDSSSEDMFPSLDGILDGFLSFLVGMSTTVKGFFDRDCDGVWQTGAAVGASVPHVAEAMTADATKSNVRVVGAFIVLMWDWDGQVGSNCGEGVELMFENIKNTRG